MNRRTYLLRGVALVALGFFVPYANYSDSLIHRIHRRVPDHIKREVDAEASSAVAR